MCRDSCSLRWSKLVWDDWSHLSGLKPPISMSWVEWDCWAGVCWCLILGFVVSTCFYSLRLGHGTPTSQGGSSKSFSSNFTPLYSAKKKAGSFDHQWMCLKMGYTMVDPCRPYGHGWRCSMGNTESMALARRVETVTGAKPSGRRSESGTEAQDLRVPVRWCHLDAREPAGPQEMMLRYVFFVLLSFFS